MKRIARGDCFYDITKIKNITNGDIGQAVIQHAAESASDVSNNSISQNSEKSIPAAQESEENLSNTTENELLSDPADDEKSDRQILAAALMSTAQKGFFT